MLYYLHVKTLVLERFPSLRLTWLCLTLLSVRDRFLLLGSAIIQILLVLLDLIGILLIGAIVAISTSAVQGTAYPTQVAKLIEVVGLENRTSQEIATVFGLSAAFFLVSKSTLSLYFTLRNTKFLAIREARMSIAIFDQIFKQPIARLQKYGTPEYQHVLTTGVTSAFSGILGGSIALLSEVFLQIVMASTLFIFSPGLLIIFFGYFGLLFLILNHVLGNKARDWSERMSKVSIGISRSVLDFIGSYREIVVSGRQNYFSNVFQNSRLAVSEFSVKNSMLGQFSKYAFEISLVIGGVAFAGYAFTTKPAIEAASLLAVFIAAGGRIAPSILRFQLGLLLIKGAFGSATVFFEIYKHVRSSNDSIEEQGQISTQIDYSKGIELKDVSFTYPESVVPALDSVSAQFQIGKLTAIVGPSGSGKSTLVDTLLGVLNPDKGDVRIFGVPPRSTRDFGITVGYVPQTVYISNCTVLENVCFGIDEKEIDLEKASSVLKKVMLSEWVESLPEGVRTLLGERGSKMSGGQRQRLGIARALYADPSLLVLDEATSALDSISEHEITETIARLGEEMTMIVIAHRLSTVQKAAKIFYLRQGKVVSEGTFSELRERIPDFDRQAELMGIER